MESLCDVLRWLDVLDVSSSPHMDLGDDDHHLSKHDGLLWESAIVPSQLRNILCPSAREEHHEAQGIDKDADVPWHQ